MNELTQSILTELADERRRQDEKFGSQRMHSPAEWLMILGEEVGEANQAALEAHFWSHKGINLKPLDRIGRLEKYRKELIQVAAVAVAAIETLDNGELHPDHVATLVEYYTPKPMPAMGGGSTCDGPCGMHCLCEDED